MHEPSPLPSVGPGAPTAPIELRGGGASATSRIASPVDVPAGVVDRLRSACASVIDDAEAVGDASRDWWPLAMTWALEGQVPGRAAVVARPSSTDEVAAVLSICNEARVPVTASAGRSGVCGGAVPVFGGVVLDLCGIAGIVDVDDTSLLLDVRAGTFGDVLETELRTAYGVTLGHWPQSIALSTVGGWLACRSAGQYSTRYGKIEDMVVGLDVVLADGTQVRTGGAPRAANGPDLTQLFVGSEGTLGVITGARLRLHPAPVHERREAFGFASFTEGLEACRRILRRGATPAVIRLYDAAESKRNFDVDDVHVLLVMDEGDPEIVDTTMEITAVECEAALPLDQALVVQWLGHRNDVAALEALVTRDYVVDTMEIAGPWRALPEIYERTTAALMAVEHNLAATAHQSHSYTDGACLYFTFAGKPPAEAKDTYYRTAWDAGTRAVLAVGGALSHHHGVGLNRARFMEEALGTGFDVLAALKRTLDPNGILNPGKLGLPTAYGAVPWP